MYRINLLPVTLRAEYRQKSRRLAAAAWTLALFAMVACYGWQCWRITEMRRQIALIPPEPLTAESRVSEGPRWTVLLLAIGDLLPPEVWLTEISASQDCRLTLTGQAPDYRHITRLLQNLRTARDVTEVTLVRAERSQKPEAGVAFVVSLKMVTERKR